MSTPAASAPARTRKLRRAPVYATTPSRAARSAVLAAAALTLMAAAVIAPSLPAMAASFRDVPGGTVLVRLALTVTSLAIAITAPLAGVLIDRIGRRPLLLASLGLYTVAGSRSSRSS